jgi:hypothetical protein
MDTTARDQARYIEKTNVTATIHTFVDNTNTPKDGAARKLLAGTFGMGATYTLVIPECTADMAAAGDCPAATFMTVPSARMRELSIDEAHSYRRRRLGAVGLAEEADSSAVHFPECLVFHCFKGDEGCEEPSPHEACLRIGDDGSCADPLCRYYVDEE